LKDSLILFKLKVVRNTKKPINIKKFENLLEFFNDDLDEMSRLEGYDAI
jgi:hypothetical protein